MINVFFLFFLYQEVDGHKIPKDAWAKAFIQTDICHAAGILFKALFTTQEIQNCTLRGRNGTSLLDVPKEQPFSVSFPHFWHMRIYKILCIFHFQRRLDG